MSNTNYTERLMRELKETEYKKMNLSRNPFLPFAPYQEEVPPLIERDKELEESFRYIASMMNGQLNSLIVLGTKGIGKTHFILKIFKILKDLFSKETSVSEMFELKFIRNAPEFFDFYSNYFEKIQKSKIFLLIDDADQIWARYTNELKEIYDNQQIIVFSTWNMTKWMSLKRKQEPLPRSRSMTLEKISRDGCIKIIKSRLQESSIDKNKKIFTEDAMAVLADVSEGIPYTLLNSADTCLQYALAHKTDLIDKDVAIKASTETGLFSRTARRKLFEMTRAQISVLRQLWEMTSSSRRSATASQIALELSVTRSAIVQHIKALEEKHIVSSKKIRKEVFYAINPELLQYIEKYFQFSETGMIETDATR